MYELRLLTPVMSEIVGYARTLPEATELCDWAQEQCNVNDDLHGAKVMVTIAGGLQTSTKADVLCDMYRALHGEDLTPDLSKL